MKKVLALVLLPLVFFGLARQSRASGFLIYEHGASAMAMAGAFVSLANDPTAIFHNPAGIAFLKGTQFSLGTTLIWSKSKMELPNWPVQSQQNWEQISQVFYPSTVYFTQSLGEKVTLGLGFFSPYGLGAKWPKENPLKYLGYEDDMKTFFFNPTVAVKLAENVSIGVGISYVYSTVEFKLVDRVDLSPLNPYLGVYDVPASLEGNGSAFALNGGLLYRGNKFSLGFNWRGGFSLDYKGDLTLDTGGLPAAVQPVFPNKAGGNTTFHFPHILGIGASYSVTEKFLLTADVHFVLWSSFDKYEVEFDNVLIPTMVVEQKWDDSFLLRGGFQYMINSSFALRGGVLYDQTPQPVESTDPLLPDADRVAVTVGIGYKLGKFVLDLAFQHEVFSDRKAPNRSVLIHPLLGINLGEGTYKTTANLLGISFGYVF